MVRKNQRQTSPQHPLTHTFSSMRQRLQTLARRLLHDSDDADDAVQEAFMRLWSRRDTIGDSRQADAMSVTTVRNVCIDMLRRSAAHPHQSLEEARPPDETDEPPSDEAAEIAARVSKLLELVLTPTHREILCHRDRDGWSVDELAIHYHTTAANIRVILSRSRKAVREAYLKH